MWKLMESYVDAPCESADLNRLDRLSTLIVICLSISALVLHIYVVGGRVPF